MILDLLSIHVSVYIGAIGYLWVAIVCAMWAFELQASLYERLLSHCPNRPARLRFIPKWIYCRAVILRRATETLDFWFAGFLLFSDGAVYVTIGSMLSADRFDTVYLWQFGILIAGAVFATGAYYKWSSAQPGDN